LPRYDPIAAYLAVAIVYMAMVYLLDLILRWIESGTRIPGFEMEGKKA
jgi:ABC-type amino acid transport system permease subunit